MLTLDAYRDTLQLNVPYYPKLARRLPTHFVSERGIDFCGRCEEYPCDDLKQFQSAREESMRRRTIYCNADGP